MIVSRIPFPTIAHRGTIATSMPYADDDAEEELEEREYPDPADSNWDQDTTSCPYCKAEIYDQAERCPRCGKYISDETAPARRPWWIIIGAVAVVVIVIGWILGRS
jgi:uncharacterized paraquat-inducible protein A